eukprot:SAG22_NODE_529_length_9428_cov_2.691178_3_plen_80_part_00
MTLCVRGLGRGGRLDDLEQLAERRLAGLAERRVVADQPGPVGRRQRLVGQPGQQLPYNGMARAGGRAGGRPRQDTTHVR